MANLELLLSRKSHNRLVSPAPTKEQVFELFKLALRAPDHALLKPWRYLVFSEDALATLGDYFVESSLLENPEISEDKLERIRNKPKRAPMVIVSIATIKQHKNVPEIEQILSSGAAVQNLIMGAHLQGLGAIWRTGGLAFSRDLMTRLGLSSSEQITGFIYLGQEEGNKAKVKHPEISEFVEWIN